jgi:transcriptional regulator with XRE-family HTH domain
MSEGQQLRPTSELAEVGARIREARRELNLTQAAFATRIGLPLGLVDRLESGKANALPHIAAIAAATGRPPEWFSDEADVAQLMRRVQELEARNHELESRTAALERRLELAELSVLHPVAPRLRPSG